MLVYLNGEKKFPLVLTAHNHSLADYNYRQAFFP